MKLPLTSLMEGYLSYDTVMAFPVPETSVRATVWGQHAQWEEASAQGSSRCVVLGAVVEMNRLGQYCTVVRLMVSETKF